MSELVIKLFFTLSIPFAISITGFFQSKGFDVELMYWGAIGQALALIVQFADQRKKAKEKRDNVDWVLYAVNLAKASFLALFFSSTVVEAGWISSPHFAAILIGILADLAMPLLNHFKRYFNDKITK